MESKAQGNKLYSQGKTQEAIKAYGRGIDLVEDGEGGGATVEDGNCLHMLYSNRSMAHLDLCLVDEALQDAECAIDANPEYGKAYARRAAVMVDLWNFKEALQDLDKAEELDPSLTESLAELRLRATGKKWVPNCYLRKQIEMRKKYKCDYVAMLELEGEEKVVEPVFFPRKRDLEASMTIGDPQSALRALIESGDAGPQAGYLILNLVGMLSQKTRSVTDYEKMIKDQIQREFGPNEATAARDSVNRENCDLQAEPLESRYFLVHSLQQFRKMGDNLVLDSTIVNTTPVLFPGRPRWLFEEQLRCDFFALAEGSSFNQTAIRLLKAHREEHLQRDGKCYGCATALTEPDPQECVCGQQYCSYLCHLDHWDSHQQECHDIMGKGLSKSDVWERSAWERTGEKERKELIPNLRLQTFCYWLMVAQGQLPFKDEPNVVDLWKERNITFEEHGKTAFHRELEFYRECEVAAMGKREDVFQSKPNADPRLVLVAREDFLATWRAKMQKPLPTDSCARIVIKYVLCEYLELLSQKAAGEPLGGTGQLHIVEGFVGHLRQHRSDDPCFPSALKILSLRGGGNVFQQLFMNESDLRKKIMK